jgi:TRAP-type C4-dicarboxylate transport system permease small subunit
VEAEASKKEAGAPRWVERLLKFVALLGGLILFAIMLLITVAVFNRKVLNDAILGDFELVQIGLSLVVMMAMPYVTLREAHIRVDILDRFIGSYGRFFGDVFARLTSIFVLYLLIEKTLKKTLDAHKYGDVTNMIEIPVSIAYGAITIGFGLTILVFVGQLVSQCRKGPANYE